MTKIQYLKSILEKIEEKQTELFIRRTSLPIDEYYQWVTLLDEYYKQIKTELEIQQIILLQSPDTYKNEITSDDEFQIQTLRRLKIKEEELFKKWTSIDR